MTKPYRNFKRNRPGFSLIEILVAIVIISILATVVVVQVVDKPAEARQTACRSSLQSLQTALQLYKAEQGRYPTQNQGLSALVEQTRIPPVPEKYPVHGYLQSRKIPVDPWGSEFVYLIPGRQNEAFEIMSYGADREPGGIDEDADLSSRDL